MCNLYSHTKGPAAIRAAFPWPRTWIDRTGNLEPGDIYPDRVAPIVRREGEDMVLELARWGLPSPPQYHSPSGIDRGVTNVRNAGSAHWRRWLGPDNRCLVPLDRFAEPRGGGRGNAWFKLAAGDPAFFAGIRVPAWRSIRKLRDGETVDDLFAFLTCPPNAEVGAIHPKAMPVILVAPVEWDTWLTAPWDEARALQRPLPDGALEVSDV